ncbi:MAG: tetraacyldisaccharide 4'-kinase [Pirellulales bacterium]
MRPSQFRRLVSGEWRGPGPTLVRAALAALAVPYTAAVRMRNRRYDAGRAPVTRLEVPVVSVGNITLGGTGKTPTVEWLARWFAGRGVRVGVVSRGYRSKEGRPNDEALELAQKLPDLAHVADTDRVRGARQAVGRFGCQLLLVDDGFQHRRLARDFDLVLIDALEPFGFGHVFPRGTLREPLSGWARADALMLTRADMVDAPGRAEIREHVTRYAPAALWLEATHAPQALLSASGAEQPLETLAGQRIAAFCGIGNPAGFRHSLAHCRYQVAASVEFADHMHYTPEDIREIARWADALDVAAVLCTHKDLVKVGEHWTCNIPLWALAIRLEILAGQAPFEAALGRLAQRALEPR